MSCYESQDVTGDAERVTDGGEMSHDTREKLEADVRKAWSIFIGDVFDWLDRQAAITERECMEHSTSERVGFDCAECAEGLGRELDARCDPLKARIAELCDQVDELKAKLDAEAQHAREAWRLWGEADVKLERMTAERDQWRDAYRDSERMRLELVKDLEHARRWSDKWRDLVHRYEGLCDGLLDERDAMRGDA